MVTQTELDELNGTAERTALSVVISWALAARRDPPPSGLFLADDLDWASAQISFMMAEAERLRANQERLWCSACGTVTRDKQCDCTKFSDQDTQSLVNYADAMQEAAHEEAQENERLRATIAKSCDEARHEDRDHGCTQAILAECENEKLRAALTRLGSVEAFDVSRVIDARRDKELIMRIDFARDTLEQNGDNNAHSK